MPGDDAAPASGPRPPARDASQTAFGVTMLRAVHQLLDGEPKVLDDPVAVRLAGPELLERIRVAREQADDARARTFQGLRSHVLTRSRFAEDRLALAVERRVRQYVLLGAGLDTFAYRQPPWAASLRIFEVDHPASQAAKLEALARAGLVPPPNLTLVASDLEAGTLPDDLRAHGFDSAAPAFLSCLGVLVYLSGAAVDALFAFAGSLPAGSELVLSFAPPDAELPREDAERRERLARLAADAGEPWRTHLSPERVPAMLHAHGFSEVTILSPADTFDRYLRGRTDGLPMPRTAYLASAVV